MKHIFFFIIHFMAIACKKSDSDNINPDVNNNAIKLPAGGERVIASSNNFGLDIFRKVIDDEPIANNVFISPTSISLALSMTWNGADGTTKDSMAYALRFPNLQDDEINNINKELITGLTTADNKVILNIANSIWYRQDFQVEQDFVTVNKNYYDAEVRALDFASSGAKDVINNWVEDKTNGKIRNMVDNIPSEARMFLIDAIYFKGTWKIAFVKQTTQEAQFTLADGSQKTVQMMNMKDSLGYFENDVFQAVQLDYGSGNFSMVVLLPKENHVTGDILASMTSTNWQNWMNSFEPHQVGLKMPKFKFEYFKELNDILAGMGMGIAFTDMADFTRINPEGNLLISYVKHKTFLEVDEEGTEAAAATIVGIWAVSYPESDPTKYMTVDHPFIFAIREKSTNAIVFIGRVSNPEYQE
jgi:serine protease inhibitor